VTFDSAFEMRYETYELWEQVQKLTGKWPSFVRIVIYGLITAEVVASLHVYLSNQRLYASLTAIQAAGYLPVPGPLTMVRLQLLAPALAGGLFFALTLGAGLTLITLTAVWAWVRLLAQSRLGLAILILGWAAMLFAVNSNGLNLLPLCYFLVIPAVVGLLSLIWALTPAPRFTAREAVIPLLPVLLLAALWWTQLNEDMFLRIRDHLLLSNPAGRAVNDFYYRYTLYAAEAFKPLHQKTLKTCFIEDPPDQRVKIQAESSLRGCDVLPIFSRSQADMIVDWDADAMIFKAAHAPTTRILQRTFFSNPDQALVQVSLAWDRNSFLRTAVFLSLLLGFPVALYCLAFGLFTWMLELFLKPGTARYGAAMICLLLGSAFFYPLWQARVPASLLTDVHGALASDRWQIRVAALRRMADRGMEIADSPTYRNLLSSPQIAERYWLARALGVSRRDETYPDLIRLLDDPHPNVVCQAYHGLGQRGNRAAVERILEKMQTSEHWYSQWYGYRALKALGWIQTRSTQKPS
jgi:hypothetical protein